MPNPLHFKKIITLALVGTILGAGLYHEILNEKIIEPAMARAIEYTINPEIAPFTFDIVPFIGQPNSGTITIYQNDTITQTITLEDPNMFLADRVDEFFTVTDINFDGYADIGVLEEGGSKWSAYQYWLYDKTTNQFITSDFTKNFRALNFNQIKFDPTTKQIRTNNFCGPLICDKDTYEARDNRLILIETHHQEQPYSENGIEKKCVISITKYQDGKEKTATESIDEFCPGYYWKI